MGLSGGVVQGAEQRSTAYQFTHVLCSRDESGISRKQCYPRDGSEISVISDDFRDACVKHDRSLE